MMGDPKHSKYSSELEDLLDLYAGYVVDWANGYTSDNKYEAKRTETLAKITALVNKEKAKAELVGRIDELDKAHTANSLGEWADYFLERRESLAQLAKGKDNHADQ